MADTIVKLDAAAIADLFSSEQGMVGKELARRAIAVERMAKRLAPVDTGRLRASITHDLARDNRGLLAMIGSNVTYAAHQEFGTRFQSGQPYLRPALRAAGR